MNTNAALRQITSRSLELALLVLLAATATGELALGKPRPAGELIGVLLVSIAVIAALTWRRRHPLTAALIPLSIILAAGPKVSGGLPDTLLVVMVVLAYSLGAHASGGRGILGLSALVLSLVASGLTHDSVIIGPLVVGAAPWAAGRAVRARRRLADQLAQRAEELDLQRELFVREAVRFERTRMARELHDIVAHSVSLMVVQAAAGRRLAAADPSLAAEALDNIAQAAHQASAEVVRVVELLGDDAPLHSGAGLTLIGELVERASDAGLVVSSRFSALPAHLPAPVIETAYRLVQESLTNALKHAPGAAVEIVVRGESGGVGIEVVNGPASLMASGLESLGGGNGLVGMRERVTAGGGAFQAGPTKDGGWRVVAAITTVRELSGPRAR